jgi:hypothetical protein
MFAFNQKIRYIMNVLFFKIIASSLSTSKARDKKAFGSNSLVCLVAGGLENRVKGFFIARMQTHFGKG